MDLTPYGNAIGISDILQYRTCPERFIWGMRRHLELPERLRLYPGERDDPPEAINWTNAYGSAIHEAINRVELGDSHTAAIERALATYGTYLTPADIELLTEDLERYEFRHPKGMDLVSAERDMRVPLFEHNGVQIYFRFKLDVLFRSHTHPDVFLHRDYKSSAHRKTKQEVHSDVQMWAYNWGIHEMWPEARMLFQEYDQLKFGVERTSKNAQQRAEIKQWLIAQVKILLADDTFVPKINQFCPWCPLVVTCRETRRATTYWRGKLALTAPLRKDGRKIKVEFLDEGDDLEAMIRDDLPKMREARKHIEKVESELKTLIEAMSIEDRERLGWRISERRSHTITPEGMREMHALLGDTFYELVNLPTGRLGEHAEAAEKWSIETVSASTLTQVKPR